ncbi:Protein CBG08539 [Caenorhabditis briggsae]|uniref:Protein CBG08539 n=1 Tax=Caenorhabditis briggsae TaxID=6238 RepID=A8X762_CAEBR|nr:Protein CBG08539 [Caenorhabditis briggsae]CAP28473.1 Protein CBG08539 [Caenorhabditis briggsae]
MMQFPCTQFVVTVYDMHTHQSAKSTTRRPSSHRSKSASTKRNPTGTAADHDNWTTLQHFTKRASKAIDLIAEARRILDGVRGEDFIPVLQASYRKLYEFITTFNNSNSEALSLIDKHTALSSSSETRNKNYLALSQHLTDKDYDLLSGSMEDLLTEITQILQNETGPFVPAKKTDDTPVISAQAKEMISKLPSLHSISQSEGSDKIEEHSSYQVAATKPPAAPIVVKKLFTKEPEAISSGLQHNSTPEHLKELPVITQSGTIPHEPQAGSTIQGDILQDILTNFMKNFDKKFQNFSEKTEHKLQQMKQLQGHFIQQLEGLQDNMSLVQDQLNQHTMAKEQASEISEINQDNEDKGNSSYSDDKPPVDSKATFAQKHYQSPPHQSPHYPSPPMGSPQISPVNCSPTLSISYPATDISNILNTLNPFSGNPDEYALFITRFTSLVHNYPGIDTIMKLNILISLLKDEAQELITSDDLSEDLYNTLRENLELVYNRTSDRRKHLMDDFRKMPVHQTDYKQMARDVMKHVCLMNSLKKNDITVDDPLIIDLFVEKLPFRIMKSVVKKNRVKLLSFMQTVSLVQSLISENRTVDEAKKKKNSSTPLTEVCVAEVNHVSSSSNKPHSQNHHKQHFKERQQHEKQFQERPKTPYQLLSCLFCLKGHEAFRCKLSPQDKKSAAERKELCLNCLSNSHQTQHCKSKYSCSVCKNRHHTSICAEKEKFQQMDTTSQLLNSRPITMNPISISDTEAVRPIDFLLPRAELSLPNNPFTTTTAKLGVTENQTREYLKQLDTIRLHLWEEFYKELYTGNKAPRYKAKSHSTESPQPNHVVLVETPNLPRYRWPLARIIQLLPSKDGKVRSVLLGWRESLCHSVCLITVLVYGGCV